MIKFELEGLRTGILGIVSRVSNRYREMVRKKQQDSDSPKSDEEPKTRAELSLLRAMGKAK